MKKNCKIKIGALSKIDFKKGKYIYVGSAQKGIENRIARHYLRDKKNHWHIDYLLANKNVKIENYLYKEAGKKEECQIAAFLRHFEEPIGNFGCSDCKCEAHLFKINKLDVNKLGMQEP